MFSTDNIRKIRKELQKSQSDIAFLLNVSRSTYALWESNNNIFPIKRLLQLCDTLNISLDYALGFKNVNIKKLDNFNLDKSKIRLKEFRKDNKLTQDKLALKLNTTKAVISGYECGRRIIATPFLYTICKKYNISADYLLGRVDEPKYLN